KGFNTKRPLLKHLKNGIVERQNHTLVEAARIMLSAAKVPLFFWAEAIATACFTQNRSLIWENLDQIKEKGDECIFMGYSTQSRAYRFFNKRTSVIMESIHVNFDELPLMALSPVIQRQENVPQADRRVTTSNELDLLFSLMFDELLNGSSKTMASAHNCSDPAPTCQSMASAHNSSNPAPTCQKMASVHNSSDPTMVLEHDSLSPRRKCQENVSHGDKTCITSNELDLLFSPMFDELLNGSSKVVSKSSAVSAADAPIQQPHAENDEVADDEFINIFSTPVQDQGETSSRHVDSSNMHTFYQRYPSEQRWTKDHPLEQVIGNPSQSVRTRRQLESDAEMCMFALIVSHTEPKNIKEAMADSA
nr:integrase, catalytic region, zinc finger, CCHC-type, peptidase aspartic, catalytic [Tanacetum cinerariifolium]